MPKPIPTIKILVGYHKPAVLLKNDVLVPIHLGRALATQASKDGAMSEKDYQWMLENMIGDDTGDNISHLNRKFNELTALYWAWKNYDKLGNPDYIGFMHYRRHLIFNSAFPYHIKHNDHYVRIDRINKQYTVNIGLQQKTICDIVKNYDAIFPIPVTTDYTVKEEWGHLVRDCYLRWDDWQLMLDTIDEESPEFVNAAQAYIKNKKHYSCNVFIMKKEMFFSYCQWLFKICFTLDKKIDFSHRTITSLRVIAFLAERLTGIVCDKISQNPSYKTLALPLTRVTDTDNKEKVTVSPAYSRDNIAVVFASDASYMPYLSIPITAILKQASPAYNYDICILCTEASPTIKEKFLSLAKERTNISIRFVNVCGYMDNALQGNKNLFFTRAHLSTATYYRLFIPQIFASYQKILYLDSDTLPLKDISLLFNTDLQDYILGAVKDPGIAQLLIKNQENPSFPRGKFMREIMKMRNVFSYFQSGVLLYNIPQCLRNDFTKVNLQKLQELKKPSLADQDVLNAAWEGKVKYLPLAWNWLWNLPIKDKNFSDSFPLELLEEYLHAAKEPFLIHYCDSFKPWAEPHLPKADKFWQYARLSPFYEEILFSNILNKSRIATQETATAKRTEEGQQLALIKQVRNYPVLYLQYMRYKFMASLTFGKKKAHYKYKRNTAKSNIEKIRHILKTK